MFFTAYQQILDSSKLREFADDNFKFEENGRKSSIWEENTEGKGEIARYEQFLLFPQFFSKELYCRQLAEDMILIVQHFASA